MTKIANIWVSKSNGLTVMSFLFQWSSHNLASFPDNVTLFRVVKDLFFYLFRFTISLTVIEGSVRRSLRFEVRVHIQ